MYLHENFTRRIYWPMVQKLKRERAAEALLELSESLKLLCDEPLSF